MLFNSIFIGILLFKTSLIHAKKKRPNVLVILADDVGTGDIPGYYSDTCKVTSMKNIENLVSKGLLFTDAHATPLSPTSRYSFLTGNYQYKGSKQSVAWNFGRRGYFKKGDKSIAEMFQSAGYNTAMMGKWHLGGKIAGIKSKTNILTHPNHDLTRPFAGGPQDIGFSSSLITPYGIQMPPYSFFRDGVLQTKKSDIKWWKKGEYSMPKGISKILESGEGDADWDSTAYNMLLVEETVRFLDDHLEKRPSDPFFAYFSLGSVDIPHSPPKRYIDGTPVEKTQLTSHMDMLYELDLVVGSLMKALKDRNLLEDTIVVFTSDNGGLGPKRSGGKKFGHHPNGDFRGSKGQLYEGAHRVPLIVRYDKGLPSGQTRESIVGITDLYRTLGEMAGISVPEEQAKDSISFAKYAMNEHDYSSLRDYYGIWKDGKNQSGCAIRTMRYKLIYKYHGVKWAAELYDLREDRSEAKNVIKNPKYSRAARLLKLRLLSLGPCCVHIKNEKICLTK